MRRAKKTFLLVEDFEDSRFMMRRLLEMAGYKVVEATDGGEAVRLAVGIIVMVSLLLICSPFGKARTTLPRVGTPPLFW